MSEQSSAPKDGAGPQQPSQAEGDRETIDADLREKQGDDTAGDTPMDPHEASGTPAARDPLQHPSQAEGEREQAPD
ncbi:MAG TPA: hypothetical protein VIL85_06215 [Thermomicrobiales bacterium]|jgi:hypothetical protein